MLRVLNGIQNSWVNSDSATNNTDYNQTHFVNASGDTMTGKLEIISSELEVGGNITMAGDLIHQNDTGTKISFNTDVITLETNGQEFITIDGTAPTPDTVIINEAATVPVHFVIKTPTNQPALYFRGTDGFLGIGTSGMQAELSVMGSISASEDLTINGTTVLKSNLSAVSANFTGVILSGGTPLHDIFSTDVEIFDDLVVHGSVSAQDISANYITALSGYQTQDITGAQRRGISRTVNVGGKILHIVNGLIVGVTDE